MYVGVARETERKRNQRMYLPEPLDDRMVGAVAILVDSVLPPVIHVHIAQTTHQELHNNTQALRPRLHHTQLAIPNGCAVCRFV